MNPKQSLPERPTPEEMNTAEAAIDAGHSAPLDARARLAYFFVKRLREAAAAKAAATKAREGAAIKEAVAAAVAAEPVEPERKPLTYDEQIIYDAIPVLPKTIAGKSIVESVAKKLPGVDEPRVSRICTTTLKAYGVKNRRGAGYYRTA